MLKRWENKQQSGFTIVELLIVIVVIAILAAITIVAYNGIQTRAENSKTVTAVNAYVKALRQYALINGQYPTTGGMCLGEDYPVLADSGVAGCRYSNSVIGNSAASAARDLLKPYLGGSLPMPSTKSITHSTGISYAGIYFYGTAYNYTLSGEKVVALWYTMNDTTCPVGPVYPTTGPAPNYTGSPVDKTTTLTGGSLCMILLPDASRL
jgi:prepilin-type N-terminal cleavage/methylation domain-containing protein